MYRCIENVYIVCKCKVCIRYMYANCRMYTRPYLYYYTYYYLYLYSHVHMYIHIYTHMHCV